MFCRKSKILQTHHFCRKNLQLTHFWNARSPKTFVGFLRSPKGWQLLPPCQRLILSCWKSNLEIFLATVMIYFWNRGFSWAGFQESRTSGQVTWNLVPWLDQRVKKANIKWRCFYLLCENNISLFVVGKLLCCSWLHSDHKCKILQTPLCTYCTNCTFCKHLSAIDGISFAHCSALASGVVTMVNRLDTAHMWVGHKASQGQNHKSKNAGKIKIACLANFSCYC